MEKNIKYSIKNNEKFWVKNSEIIENQVFSKAILISFNKNEEEAELKLLNESEDIIRLKLHEIFKFDEITSKQEIFNLIHLKFLNIPEILDNLCERFNLK